MVFSIFRLFLTGLGLRRSDKIESRVIYDTSLTSVDGLLHGISEIAGRMHYDLQPRKGFLEHTHLSASFLEYKLPYNATECTPESILFEEYAGPLFRRLRSFIHLNDESYSESFGDSHSLVEFKANSKSSQKFYFSGDGRFLIKTMNNEELACLLDILPSYAEHISNNIDSLLTRFLGLYRVGLPSGQFETYLVCCNVFYDSNGSVLREKYDLKGSRVGRRTRKFPDQVIPNGTVLKDLDLTDSGRKFRIGLRNKARLMEALKKDIDYLSNHEIMDYSLLVGVLGINAETQTVHEKVDKIENSDEKIESLDVHNILWPVDTFKKSNISPIRGIFGTRRDRAGFERDQKTIKLGLIDMLQRYTFRKTMETSMKRVVYERKGISAVPPDEYAQRMFDFINDNFE